MYFEAARCPLRPRRRHRRCHPARPDAPDAALDSHGLLQWDEDPVWQNYSLSPATFQRGPQLLASTAAESVVACAQQCDADPACLWFSWCSSTDG